MNCTKKSLALILLFIDGLLFVEGVYWQYNVISTFPNENLLMNSALMGIAVIGIITDLVVIAKVIQNKSISRWLEYVLVVTNTCLFVIILVGQLLALGFSAAV